MYRFEPKNRLHRPVVTFINGQKQERLIDANDGDFVINAFGHIRSDFAVLTDTNNSIELSKALMAMETAYQENSSQFDGLTFEQMVKVVRPRWCQLPGEVDRFEQYLIDEALDFYKKLRQDEIDAVENEEGAPEGAVPRTPATLAPAGQEASSS